MTAMATESATFPELLDLLGFIEEERVSVCHQPVGGRFTVTIVSPADAGTVIEEVTEDANIWFGVNPIRSDVTGRGAEIEVTRLACLHSDLDIKPGGLPSFEVAEAVINDLSDILGVRPVAIVSSGHGLQPYWAVDPTDERADLTDPASNAAARTLLRRFGRLAAAVADRYGGKIDSVYDLARVMRVPGTVNRKAEPKPVTATLDMGAPLTIERIAEVLDEMNIPAQVGDDESFGEIVSDPHQWGWAPSTCPYVEKMISGWGNDRPEARHPWLIGQLTRLAAAHRNGCLTEADHQAAIGALGRHMTTLLARAPTRDLAPSEIEQAHAWGVRRVAAMTEGHLTLELGQHDHPDTTLIVPTTDAPPRQQPDHGQPPAANTEPDTTLLRSEDGLATLLLEHHGSVLRHCIEQGKWYAWDGSRWRMQHPEGVAREWVKKVARQLPAGDKPAVAFKVHCLSAKGTSGALRQACTDPRVSVSINAFDVHGRELNTPGGILDLERATLRPSDPDRLHRWVTSVTPDFTAPRPRWDRFLIETFGGDAALIDYVQRLSGYSIIGEVSEHILPLCIGSGGNGKGVYLETVRALLGDYATSAPHKFLMGGITRHETEIADLAGRRLVICSEIEEDDRFAEDKVKLLTGGDALKGRFMHRDYFTFTPTHTLWLVGNVRPSVKAGGRSFWRRLREIPFLNEPLVMNGRLKEELIDAEGPAILAWVAEGAAAYLREGLIEPRRVAEATEEYRSETDTVGRFVAEHCRVGGGNQVQVSVPRLREVYASWCHRVLGEEPVSAKLLSQTLGRLGIGTSRTMASRFYTNITILNEEGGGVGDDRYSQDHDRYNGSSS
jgi:P4 family phage/plasmid primase-like protien